MLIDCITSSSSLLSLSILQQSHPQLNAAQLYVSFGCAFKHSLPFGIVIQAYHLQGQELFKKESDVGMLLTGIQSTETGCM